MRAGGHCRGREACRGNVSGPVPEALRSATPRPARRTTGATSRRSPTGPSGNSHEVGDHARAGAAEECYARRAPHPPGRVAPSVLRFPRGDAAPLRRTNAAEQADAGAGRPEGRARVVPQYQGGTNHGGLVVYVMIPWYTSIVPTIPPDGYRRVPTCQVVHDTHEQKEAGFPRFLVLGARTRRNPRAAGRSGRLGAIPLRGVGPRRPAHSGGATTRFRGRAPAPRPTRSPSPCPAAMAP